MGLNTEGKMFAHYCFERDIRGISSYMFVFPTGECPFNTVAMDPILLVTVYTQDAMENAGRGYI